VRKPLTAAQKADKKIYDKERHDKLRALKPPKVWVSRYRYKNRGDGYGITSHKVIVEKVLGKPLPPDAEIHHVDGNGQNNTHSNLVVCPDHAYHALLHRRTKALELCGNANWLPCAFCRIYDDPANMNLYIPKDQTSPRANHTKCSTEYSRKRKGVFA
jgi:hypothetical protein